MIPIKTKSLLLIAALACGAVFLNAAEKIAAGPHGGRLLETTPQPAEFFVTPDRHVEITFYDAALQPIAPGTHTVTVTAEPASGRKPVALEASAAGFRSKAPLPAGDPYRVVVQVRATPEATPQNFRLDLVLSTCGECKRAEYACICEGH